MADDVKGPGYLSDTMADRMKENPEVITKDGTGRYNAFCIFCKTIKSYSTVRYFATHLLRHTDEPQYFCNRHHLTFYHPNAHLKCGGGKAFEEKFNYSLNNEGNYLAYLCNECTYLQVQEINMKSHYKEKHSNLKGGKFTKYSEVIVMKHRKIKEKKNRTVSAVNEVNIDKGDGDVICISVPKRFAINIKAH